MCSLTSCKKGWHQSFPDYTFLILQCLHQLQDFAGMLGSNSHEVPSRRALVDFFSIGRNLFRAHRLYYRCHISCAELKL